MKKNYFIMAILILLVGWLIAAYIYKQTGSREANYVQLVLVLLMFVCFQRYRKMDD